MLFSKPDSPTLISNFLTEYFQQVQNSLKLLDLNEISEVVIALLDAHRRGATIFLCGNGGSAATASHFANDLSKGCSIEGYRRFRVIALTDNVPLMTAWGNDTAYENIFAEQLRNLVMPGDVLIGISGSGNSPNVLRAIELAQASRALAIGFCGFGGGRLRQLADISVSTDNMVMEQVEDVHMSLCHNLATTLRSLLQTEAETSGVAANQVLVDALPGL